MTEKATTTTTQGEPRGRALAESEVRDLFVDAIDARDHMVESATFLLGAANPAVVEAATDILRTLQSQRYLRDEMAQHMIEGE